MDAATLPERTHRIGLGQFRELPILITTLGAWRSGRAGGRGFPHRLSLAPSLPGAGQPREPTLIGECVLCGT